MWNTAQTSAKQLVSFWGMSPPPTLSLVMHSINRPKTIIAAMLSVMLLSVEWLSWLTDHVRVKLSEAWNWSREYITETSNVSMFQSSLHSVYKFAPSSSELPLWPYHTLSIEHCSRVSYHTCYWMPLSHIMSLVTPSLFTDMGYVWCFLLKPPWPPPYPHWLRIWRSPYEEGLPFEWICGGKGIV